jgi:hypothetical protein
MTDPRVKEVWNEIVHRAAQETDIELEAAVLGLAMVIADCEFEDPEVRELLVRGAALAWRHTDRFKAGEVPLLS